MHCPVCQAPATETTAACGQCGFTLAALDQALGLPPSLKVDVTDLAQEFESKETRRLQALCARLGRRFPQMRFVIVSCRPPSNVTLSLYAFWLFNRGSVASAVEKGGANRIIMLVLDAASRRACCMIGYGLEPFVGQVHLAAALESMRPAMNADEPGAAAEAFCVSMAAQLEQVATQASRVYGLESVVFEGLQQLTAPDDAAAFAY